MDWKAASAYYESRLSDILNVERYAMSLAELPQAEIPEPLKKILEQEVIPTRRQLERLKKREFRIAVVGLEKAGKSTFLNAWLDCDLLPAKPARCTFTTTQIYSVVNDSEQRLEVQVKTEEQFNHLQSELKTANAQEDLNTIHQNQQTLNEVRQNGHLNFPFTRLEDIKNHLNKYVADERYAHAVLEARLYTNKLAQAEGIVFYDVPGLDSGLAKHVDEAQQMLSDCDAVILVQRFTSLREKELSIIKFTEQGDKNVTVADKLFVFLSRIDALASPEALQQHLTEAAEDWSKRASLPKERIISGSAGAYLILNGLAEHQTQLEIGNVDVIESQLKRLMQIEDPQALIEQGTGIPTIKSKIFQYINTERVDVLRKRCEAFISTILDTAGEIYDLTRKKYPENPEEAKRTEEERRRVLFSEWWDAKWEQIKADLQQFYDTSVAATNQSSTKPASVEKFRERYAQVVEQAIQDLHAEALHKRDIIFAANSNPVFDRTNANFRWRESLYIDVIKTLDLISHQLATELQEQAFLIIDYMTDLLWGSPLVRDRLISDKKVYFSLLENSLRVLFLRFTRPVAEALIRGPLGSDTRQEIFQNLGVDIEIVDNYYSGDEPAYQRLKNYAKYGVDLLVNSETRKRVLGSPTVSEDLSVKMPNQDATPQEIVSFEVESDIMAFAEYLRRAIFDAAGFESYCTQEFKSLVDRFRDQKGTWSGAVQNEWYRGNASLLSDLPSNLQPQEMNLEVSERLRQLGSALRDFKNWSESSTSS
ncbi:dynamin family protein [Spirulina major CS-329]|uniref:dynamin family protein n=1 Tax=Spirulina TaxID=1154 RepID=UPI00232BEAF3|nr:MULTISPECIES: dynamin family protein [Spirulina]MDB9495092.1 dynamin family protein [Spirulina subsalsa CS-330]MDB9501687.1 dynamin family protein [Spirulina major CS-329]